jgi:hypothetical protein
MKEPRTDKEKFQAFEDTVNPVWERVRKVVITIVVIWLVLLFLSNVW